MWNRITLRSIAGEGAAEDLVHDISSLTCFWAAVEYQTKGVQKREKARVMEFVRGEVEVSEEESKGTYTQEAIRWWAIAVSMKVCH